MNRAVSLTAAEERRKAAKPWSFTEGAYQAEGGMTALWEVAAQKR